MQGEKGRGREGNRMMKGGGEERGGGGQEGSGLRLFPCFDWNLSV